MAFVINPIGSTAAEVVGLDCAKPFGPYILQAIQDAFLEYPVLVFRNQNLSATELSAFSRQFGVLGEYDAINKGSYSKSAAASLPEFGSHEKPDRTLHLHPDDSDASDVPAIGIIDNAERHSDVPHKAEPHKVIVVHAINDPGFRYRRQWREKDLVIWDNRRLNHRVLGYAANDRRR